VSVKLRRPATYEQMLAAWAEFQPLKGIHEGKGLPSAPEFPVQYADEADRPQPRLDKMRGAGMAATVGRLRPCNLFDWKFVVLSHNTVRGAAGAAVLNAEILAMLGKLDRTPAARELAVAGA
jgi:aspartate-semialdehyde dehydrogenase